MLGTLFLCNMILTHQGPLSHPDFSGFDPLHRVPKQELCEEFIFLPRLLNGDAFDLSVGPPMLP